jgi:serine/threonine-protein kinase RsbW
MDFAPIFSKVSDYSTYAELRQLLPSQVPVISTALDQTLNFIAGRRKADGSEIDIEVALGEAITNAVIHGNRERSSKHVLVTCRCSREGDVAITVQDQGMGFESDTIPDRITPENRFSESGRGIYLMSALMDLVRFERQGSVVHMWKRSSRQSASERDTR